MSYSSKSKSSKESSKYYTPLSNISSEVIKSKTSKSSNYYTPLSSNSISIKSKLQKSTNLFITDKRIEKIQKFLQKYTLDDKYTLDNRVKYYKYLLNYIKDIKNRACIKKYIEDNITKYTIGNKLFLIKKIGTESINGVIYLTIIKNILGGNLLACKIMPIDKNNYREIKIMQNLTDKVISKKKSKHFLIMYKYIVCPPMSILEMIKNPLGNSLESPLGRRLVSSNKRLVCINELAHGDLDMLMKNKKVVANDEVMYNIFIQTFLSIISFHNLSKYYHGDAHSGNFLYQINKEKGYYHYTYNKTDYYLKACEYNIMIYDFGYATKAYKKYNKKSLLDYINIINTFIRDKWAFFPDLPSDKFNTKMIFIKDRLMIEYKSGNKEGDIKNIIVNNILLKALENTSSTFNLFTKNKPSNIINKTPYILG